MGKAIRASCLRQECDKAMSVSLLPLLINPFEFSNNNNDKELHRLFSYFLYNAPGIESIQAQKLPTNIHSPVFEELLRDRHFYQRKFYSANTNIGNALSKSFLNGDSVCLKCKRFICKRKKIQKLQPEETDLDCFLRHIRNAIAHGRVYCLHKSNKWHFVFEDVSSASNISARIICIKSDLAYWKKTLERYQRSIRI